jgi:lysophospholipase L1-like esterase
MKQDYLFKIIEEGYKRRIKHFEHEKYLYDIVLAGDSLVAYMNTHQLFPDVSIMNQGIPGDTTKGLYERISYILKVKPKKVFINIGSNDLVILKHQPKTIVNDVQKIINELKRMDPHVSIFLFNITPVNANLEISNHSYISNRSNEDIQEINELIEITFSKDMILNIYDKVIDDHKQLAKKYTTDGIHLNDLGYSIYKTLIEEKL